jgi:Na+/H+ antiporter NhaD/arsenite permease-like protein
MDTATVLAVFSFVYLGMFLGEIPGLKLDRTGVALLGAIFLLATENLSPREAWDAVNVSAISLLLGLMVVSAQFKLGGFYTLVTGRLAKAKVRPDALLAMVIGAAGLLSALLVNDVVCLALTPLLVDGCARRGLDPVPFLLALACSANVGSAATLMGNPQNMLIGEVMRLSFAGYLLDSLVPVVLGLGVVWLIIRLLYRGRWLKETPITRVEEQGLNAWQTSKGIAVLALLVLAFLFTSWPRDILALAAAGILLTSRRMATRDVLGLVDWQLIVLFIGLFVVNHALDSSGLLAKALAGARASGLDTADPAWLFGITVVLSNLVSNVPAVMLLLHTTSHPLSGPILALASTLAGNLLVVGSIANIIVVDMARRSGVTITWREHARTGIPVTMATLALAAGWLWLRAGALSGMG